MNVYEKLQHCRVELQSMKLKKSGENKFAKFKYYELADFLPAINDIFDKYKLSSNFSMNNDLATLTIIDFETKEENSAIFTTPSADIDLKGCTAIQALGAKHTYLKRYLYLNALEIVENDMLDATVGKQEPKKYDMDAPNNDVDLLLGFEDCQTVENVEKYWKQYHLQAKDKEAFKNKGAEMKAKILGANNG